MRHVVACVLLLLPSLSLATDARVGECFDLAAGILAMHGPKPPAPAPAPTPPGVCTNCNGKGRLGDGTVSVICPACNGTGKRTTVAEQLQGQMNRTACPCLDCKCKDCECGHPNCRSVDADAGRLIRVEKTVRVPYQCRDGYCRFYEQKYVSQVPIDKLLAAQKDGWRIVP